ncbi:hypothetical protein QR680_018378 [Steinernema hermaphroditum]|uniref:Importin N-terminal domain-containing protein n=1 Tax=Steinernema hermaphroditum TaxID=289476 RepID=A0AA39LQX5_9BILA|nr:hypothetical protein QR680_018378 [Steinernema hermaphroditum]
MSNEFLEHAHTSLTTPGGLDVAVLDKVVAVMNGAPGADQKKALEILTQLKDSPDAWTSVDFILEKSALMQTKYFALQILEATVCSKWKSLPRVQCEGIKGFIISNILEISSDSEKYEQMKLYIQKLNLVLVQIVKQEWPNHWTTFMQDIVGSSRSNESLCMNNLTILRLLSEEVFEFEQDLTSAKGHRLKQKFCGEVEAVFRLCHAVMESSESASLIDNTLRTLHRFLSWIPVGYIFETNLITLLTTKFLPFPVFRSVTVQCLTEIASIDITDKNPEYRTVLVDLLLKAIGVLSEQISPDVDMNASYHNGSDEDQKFVANLAQFLATYMKVHHKEVEVLRDDNSDQRKTDIKRAHQISLKYLLKISEVEDVEVFKICLDYWNWLTTELYRENPFPTSAPLLISAAFMTNRMPDVPRRTLYDETLSRLRTIMISRMAKPEEVLVVENDSGEVVRELIKDTDSINLYKTMRETLVYLTHLDTKDTEAKMTEKLQNQVNGSEWSWKNLNTLCWAVGSISGSMHTEDEKRFLVTVIRDLLGLCEQKRGKDNKAVIASNIMYVVGQYPRFLRDHWKFLKTVINKLFEFMHESHEGVQDMACDTFIKIATKCKRHFVITQVGETQPFVDDMLQNLSGIICDLSPPQVHVFYEAVGHIIQSQNETVAQEALIERLMTLPNSIWDEIITHVANDTGVLRDEDVVKNIVNLLKTNVAACRSIGHPFFYQLSKILIDMLNVYKVISENMSAAVAEHGEGVLKQNIIKQMRAAKKEMLVLLTVWISKCNNANMTMEVMEPLFDAVLFDYARNTAMAREPNVLSLLSTMVTALKNRISSQIPRILDAVFKVTLEMIDKELTAYPEHRLNFFVLLRDIAQHCFDVLIAIPDTDFRLLLEADVWALQHQMRDVAEVGIEILKEVLVKVSDLDLPLRQGFYTQHFMYLLEQTLAIATDRNQVQIIGLTNLSDVLCHLFTAVEKHIPGPLSGKPEGLSNADYIFNWLSALLSQHFSQNLNADQIRVTSKGFFSFNSNVGKMRDHLRDFLIQLREETGEDTSDLYIEEKEAEIQTALNQKMAVPGIKNPNEIDDEHMK